MRTRWRPIISLILVLMLLLSACGGGSGGSRSTTEQDATKPGENAKKVQIAFWTYMTGDAEKQSQEELVAAFEAKFPAYDVELTYVPYPEMRSKLLTAVQGGEGPDVVRLDGTWVAEMAEAGVLQPLGDLVSADDKADFLEAPFATGQYRGQQWAVPSTVDVLALLYNKRLLKEAGFEAPPETMDEFVQMAKKLTNPKKGVWGFNAFHAGYWYLPFAWAYGGGMVTEERQILINNEGSLQALQLYVDLVHKYKVSPKEIDIPNDYPNAAEGFKEGKWAMTINGPWEVSNYLTGKEFKNNLDNLGIARIPRGPAGFGSPIGGGDYAIAAKAKDKKVAYDLITFLNSTESQVKLAVQNNLLPTRKSAYADPKVKDNRTLSAFLSQLEVARARPRIPEVESLFRDFDPLIQAAVLGQKTPKQALDELAKAWEGLLRK